MRYPVSENRKKILFFNEVVLLRMLPTELQHIWTECSLTDGSADVGQFCNHRALPIHRPVSFSPRNISNQKIEQSNKSY